MECVITNVNIIYPLKVVFTDTEDFFLIEDVKDLKINTYVEFKANVKGVSQLKAVNTKMIITCSNCGLLLSKNIMRQQNKMYNPFVLANDKKFHQCEESTEINKIIKEFSDPIYIRYMLAEIENVNCNNTSSKVICIVSEDLLGKYPIWEDTKICGLVRTRPNAGYSNEILYEKIVYVINLEQMSYNLNDPRNDLKCLKLPYSNEEIFKFQKLSEYKCIASYLILNIIKTNSKMNSKFDFLNFLSLYLMTSSTEHLKVHIIDNSKIDLLKQTFSYAKDFPNSFVTHDFSQDSKAGDDLIFNKDTKKDDCILKFGKIFTASNKHLILDNLPSNLNLQVLSFLSRTMKGYNESSVHSQLTESSNSHVYSNFKKFNSIVSSSKVTDFSNCNLAQLLCNYDMLSVYNYKLDAERDRNKTNQIIENQFNVKKRKFSDLNYYVTQKSNKSNIKGAALSQFTQINPNAYDMLNEEDLYFIDTKSFDEFYKKVIQEDLETIKKDNFLNENATKEPQFLIKYVKFLTEFITPKIDLAQQNLIKHLSLHLINSFSDLATFELIKFDRNGSSIAKLLTKLSTIIAKLNIKEQIDAEDILKAYVFVKEIIQQNFILCLQGKTQNVNKNKKNKMSFLIDKIKSICRAKNSKIFTLNEIREACEFVEIHDEIDKIIENLNYMGFMIKLNSEEYQLS